MLLHSKTVDITKSEKLERSFEPTMKTLSLILKTITANGPETITHLSLYTNLNYARLAKYIAWLEKKGLVESITDNYKINIGLTTKGREFATEFCNLINA